MRSGEQLERIILRMMNKGISWTHDTLNFWLGCDKVSEECLHCYIYRVLRKFGLKAWGDVVKAKSTWGKSYVWEEYFSEYRPNEYMRMFTCSLSDFFHKKADNWRPMAWATIKNTPHCVYLILTKRPERILKQLPADWGEGYPNVWIGCSIGSNKTVYRADVLRKIPAAIRFLSCEPLLEDITGKLDLTGIQWVIAGGESGEGEEYKWDSATMDWKEMDGTKGRRTMELSWAYKLYMKANNEGIPFFFKQVTSARSGVGADSLTGKLIHEFPAPPNGGVWWSAPETKPNPLTVLPQK